MIRLLTVTDWTGPHIYAAPMAVTGVGGAIAVHYNGMSSPAVHPAPVTLEWEEWPEYARPDWDDRRWEGFPGYGHGV